jgi:hypothetical protein
LVDSVLATLVQSSIEESVKAIVEALNKKESAPIDPAALAKCVSDVMMKFLEVKKDYFRILPTNATIDPEILHSNLTKLSKGIKVRVTKTRTMLSIPIGRTSHEYQFVW